MKKSQKIENEITQQKEKISKIENKITPINSKIDALNASKHQHLAGIAEGVETAPRELERIDDEIAKRQREIANFRSAIGLIQPKISALEKERETALVYEEHDELMDLVQAYGKRTSPIQPAINKLVEAFADLDSAAEALDEKARRLRPAVFSLERLSVKHTGRRIVILELFNYIVQKLGPVEGIPPHPGTPFQDFDAFLKNINEYCA